MEESGVGLMVACTSQYGGRFVKARCHASGATYAPPVCECAELMVVSGKAKLARLSQLVGVPAAAGALDAASSVTRLSAETGVMSRCGRTVFMALLSSM